MLRRLLIHIFLLFVCLTAFGQVNQVLWGKGKALYANPIATIDSLTYGQLLYGDTLYIIFDRQSKRIVYDTIHMHVPGIVFHDTVYTTDTIYLEPEYVDLGLSVKWATFNVGATSPEDYGDYYAWGETMPKDIYSWTNYKWCDGTQNNMTKYTATDGKNNIRTSRRCRHRKLGR